MSHARGRRRRWLVVVPLLVSLDVVGCLFPSLSDLTGDAGGGDATVKAEGGADGSDAADGAGDDSARDAGEDASDALAGDGGGGPRSCAGGANHNCGTTGTEDCCATAPVPGGTYARVRDGGAPATVSGFNLDVYEVTVGRFRAFVQAGKGTQMNPPALGEGANPYLPNSGWNPSFDTSLVADTASLKAGLAYPMCSTPLTTYTDTPGPNDTLPISCVTYYEAFAFCAWDRGWLPTEAEWGYAAAAGSEERQYPWGSGIDETKACYSCGCNGSEAGTCTTMDVRPVGSFSPQGDGNWHQSDLAGSQWEWVLDLYTPTYSVPCTDCANLQSGSQRVLRGGAYDSADTSLVTDYRAEAAPIYRAAVYGIRCAR